MIEKNYEPKLYKATGNMSQEEWELERTNSLGGSDMAVLLGLSHFGKTKQDLYFSKIGVKPVGDKGKISEQQKIIFNAGHFLEESVARLFSFRTGLETYEIKAMFEHPLHPHIRGNIDRFYRLPNTTIPIGFLECKTTNEYSREWQNNSIPAQYIVQIATYMSILNMDKCQISCLFIPEMVRAICGIMFQIKNVIGELPKNVVYDFKDKLNEVCTGENALYVPMLLKVFDGELFIPEHLLSNVSDAIGDKLLIRQVERDESLEKMILEAADDFWLNYVVPRKVPSLEGEDGAAAIETINKFTTPKTSDKPIMLPASLFDEINEINRYKKAKSELNAEIKEYDKLIEKASVPIIEALGGYTSGIVETEDSDEKSQLITYKTGEYNESFPKKNLIKLKSFCPDHYDELVEVKPKKPSLSIKAVKINGSKN